MPVEQLPFTEGQGSGLEELAGAPPIMINSLTDIAGTRRARPGISAWADFPAVVPDASPVDGMAAWGDNLIYVTRDRRLWAVNHGVTALSDATVATQLDGSSRPQFVPLRLKMVVVGGGHPQEWFGTGLSELLGYPIPGFTPPQMSAITSIGARLVSSYPDASGVIRWSGLSEYPSVNIGGTLYIGHEVWDALNFLEAEAKPDRLVAIADNTNELFAFGAESLQVYSPDPVTAFAPGRTMNLGLLAPYSLIKMDDMFAFLDRERRFVLTDGRTFSDESSVISKTIESVLRGLGTVEDCWGFRLRSDRWDAAVWMFPTEGKGFIWDRRGKDWSEWRGWLPAGGYAAPTITSAFHWPERNLFLVGLSNGQIGKLDQMATTDLGATIKVELVTGFVDHGSDNWKQNICTNFVFKRGQTPQGGTPPIVDISWRDDLGPWVKPSQLSLGLAGDYDPVLPLRSTGVYRRRQWKVEYTAAGEFAFLGAREEFRLLGQETKAAGTVPV